MPLFRGRVDVVAALKRLACAALFGGMMLGGAPAYAASFSFTGNFAADDDVQLFSFTVGAASNVTLITYSYAGGTNTDGANITAGGFDPIVSIFDSSGLLFDENDDGDFPNVGIDPVTGSEFDSFLLLALGPGDYTVALTQFDNFASGPALSDGFDQSGDPDFTAIFGGCSNGQFCDDNGDNRTNFWAFDILDVDDAAVVNPVPLPAGLPLFLSGLVGLGLVARRRRKRATA